MPRVTKPCPACKTTEHLRSSADDVCSQCKRLFEFAKAELERRAEKVGDGNEIIRAPERHYAIKGFYSRGVPSKVSEAVQAALHELIMSVADPRSTAEQFPEWSGEYRIVPPKTNDWLKAYTMKKATATAIIKLDKAIRDLQKATEAGAYKEGHNLLLGLASGEMSVKDFNDESTPKPKEEDEDE